MFNIPVFSSLACPLAACYIRWRLLELLFLLTFVFENEDASGLYMKSGTVSKYYCFSFFLTLLNYLHLLLLVIPDD